jgi:hypothetical protein
MKVSVLAAALLIDELGDELAQALFDPASFKEVKKFAISLIDLHDSPVESAPFKVWRKVELGRYDSVEGMMLALKQAGCRVEESAYVALSKISFAQSVKRLSLVKVTAAELGFPNGTVLSAIVMAAIARDLELCPAEVGPALAEQFGDRSDTKWYEVEPSDDRSEQRWFRVVMDPVEHPVNNPVAFLVENGNGVKLYTTCSVPGIDCLGDDSFVFVLSSEGQAAD